MTERPILFSAAMVRALLDGTKTQTRRVVKPQPGDDERDDGYMNTIVDRCPFQVGMNLWVREAFALWREGWDRTGHVVYRADMRDKDGNDAKDWVGLSPWKPSIHMPRWASRITLELTDVRVQRVQEITENDAIAEGARPDHMAPDARDHVAAFRALWDSINGGKRGFGWDANPWAWCLTFRRVTGIALVEK